VSTNQAFTLGYVLSLIGGLIVLVVSLLNLVWFGTGASFLGGYGGYMHSMMDGYHNFMGNYASSTGFFAGVSVVSLICGIILVVAAVMLWVQPQAHIIWAEVIIVFSAISLVGMGGYFIGAILGIIGGATALSFKPRT
jgi:hypothetical protein